MEPLSDPREIRKLLLDVRFRNTRIDGTFRGSSRVNTIAPLIASVLMAAEAAGFSGEDTMTMLAYHALLQNEKLMDMQLELLHSSPGKSIFLSGARGENTD